MALSTAASCTSSCFAYTQLLLLLRCLMLSVSAIPSSNHSSSSSSKACSCPLCCQLAQLLRQLARGWISGLRALFCGAFPLFCTLPGFWRQRPDPQMTSGVRQLWPLASARHAARALIVGPCVHPASCGRPRGSRRRPGPRPSTARGGPSVHRQSPAAGAPGVGRCSSIASRRSRVTDRRARVPGRGALPAGGWRSPADRIDDR